MTASSQTHTETTNWSFPFSQTDWGQTPPAVQEHLLSLHHRLEQLQHQVDLLQGRVDKTSQTSSKPPSSDSPFTKPKKPKRHKSSGTRGG